MTLPRVHALPRRQRGFSLIEVIAAFLIFALGFGVLLEILTGSLRIAHRSQDYTQAALWAQSKLDLVGVGEPLKDGDDSGKFDDDYRWSMHIAKVDPPLASMGVEGQEQTANDRNGRNASGAQQRLATAQPMNAQQAGLEQDTGIDLYQVTLTVYWGNPGHELHTDFTTLRAIDANQNKLHQLGMPSLRRPR
jgi:general secretion pathway protein I